MPSPHHAEMTFDDLPTLQDAFRTCDRDLLVRVVMADQVQGSFPAETVGKKQRHAMEKRILTSLDAMCSLKVKRKGGKRRLLLYPEESFSLDGRTGMIKRRLSASLFDLRHIESVKKAREALGSYAYAYKQVKRISKDKRKRAIVEAEELEPQAYTLVPWEKVLAYRIWLPGSLCLRERYMVLASAFWEMTFYGFEYDRAQARAANAKAERLVIGASANDSDGEFPNAPIDKQDEDAFRAEAESLPEPCVSPYGLIAVDSFDLAYREKLACVIAVLNHNARIGNFKILLKLARPLGAI